MSGVGFEPTRANTADLKSAPLDRSGIQTFLRITISIGALPLSYTSITDGWIRTNDHLLICGIENYAVGN